MSIEELWTVFAVENEEAALFLAQYRDDLLDLQEVLEKSKLSSLNDPVQTDETLMATEIEIEDPISALKGLSAGKSPDVAAREETEIFRIFALARPRRFTKALIGRLGTMRADLSASGNTATQEILDISLEMVNLCRTLEETERQDPLCQCLLDCGTAFVKSGMPEQALEYVREASTLLDADAVILTDARIQLSNFLHVFGLSHLEEARASRAAPYLSEGVAILRVLAGIEAGHLWALATMLNNLGQALFDMDPAGAIAAVVESVAIRRELVAQDRMPGLLGLSISLNNLGHLRSEIGDLDTARESLIEAVQIRRILAAAEPQRFRALLLRSLNNLAMLLTQLRDFDLLLECTAEALAIATDLGEADSGNSDEAYALLAFAEARFLANVDLEDAHFAASAVCGPLRESLESAGMGDRVAALQILALE